MAHICCNTPLFSLPASIRTNLGKPLAQKQWLKTLIATVFESIESTGHIVTNHVMAQIWVINLQCPHSVGKSPGVHTSMATISKGQSLSRFCKITWAL
eukprot:scaffold202794_cov75-Attheya_sp.AAC.1